MNDTLITELESKNSKLKEMLMVNSWRINASQLTVREPTWDSNTELCLHFSQVIFTRTQMHFVLVLTCINCDKSVVYILFLIFSRRLWCSGSVQYQQKIKFTDNSIDKSS